MPTEPASLISVSGEPARDGLVEADVLELGLVRRVEGNEREPAERRRLAELEGDCGESCESCHAP